MIDFQTNKEETFLIHKSFDIMHDEGVILNNNKMVNNHFGKAHYKKGFSRKD